MKIILTESMFIEQFLRVRSEQFSRDALRELFSFYEQEQDVSGVELEFDPISICCDWTEYETALEAAQAYGWKAPEQGDDEPADKNEELAREWLGDQTTVLNTASGVVVLNF